MTPAQSLSVFQPSTKLSADWPLELFFGSHVKPLLVLAADRNIEQYEESLGLWSLYTGGPPLVVIDQEGPKYAGLFVRGLRARTWRGEPIGDNTIRKHVTHVQAILDLAGPPVARRSPGTRTLPAPVGLIANPPVLLKPAAYIPEVEDVFTLDEIERMYEAADVSSRPAYFRSLFRFAYNSAFRAKTLNLFQPKWLMQDELGWWAKVPGRAIKGGQGRRFYMTDSAMEALAPLLARAQPADYVLARPFEKSHFYEVLHTIQAEAGIPADRQFGLHALRKACSTELSAINPMAASWHLGHSTNSGERGHASMTRNHYTHRRVLVAAVDMLPQPEWRCGRQMRLF